MNVYRVTAGMHNGHGKIYTMRAVSAWAAAHFLKHWDSVKVELVKSRAN